MSHQQKTDDLSEIKKMTSFDSVGYFTEFHDNNQLLLDKPWELKKSFTDNMIESSYLKAIMKVVIITGASAAMGIGMAIFMSSFEFNSTMAIDTDRSTRSQLKQHFFGYNRFLKRNALHWAKFGLFIGIIETPIEMIVGK